MWRNSLEMTGLGYSVYWRCVLDGTEKPQIGVGRDDGASTGEFNPIFYRKSVVFLTSPKLIIRLVTSIYLSSFCGSIDQFSG